MIHKMNIIASDPAAALIRQQGGRLYVWPKRHRCCGNLITLASATRAPDDREFRAIDAGNFEVYLPAGLARLPDELHVDVRRFPRRVAAYWNGCAWVA